MKMHSCKDLNITLKYCFNIHTLTGSDSVSSESDEGF